MTDQPLQQMQLRTQNRLSLVLLVVLAGITPVGGQGQLPQVTVLGVGDILLGRQLGVQMEKSGDYAQPFVRIADELRAADILFGNLEGAFCEMPPFPATGMVFRLHPRAVESLTGAGFGAVSVANNHFGDGGDACMKFSLEHLRNASTACCTRRIADRHVRRRHGAGPASGRAGRPGRMQVQFAFESTQCGIAPAIPRSMPGKSTSWAGYRAYQ